MLQKTTSIVGNPIRGEEQDGTLVNIGNEDSHPLPHGLEEMIDDAGKETMCRLSCWYFAYIHTKDAINHLGP